MATKLTWSHYSELLSIKDYNKIIYYIKICENNSLSKRQLREKMISHEYERLPENTKLELIKENNNSKIEDFIKHPILLYNKNNYEVISEKILQKIILEDISSFMKELGGGYSFIDSEYKIKIGDTYNYIDKEVK